MIRLGFGVIVMSSAAAATFFFACGDSTFSSGLSPDAQVDGQISEASASGDGAIFDEAGPSPSDLCAAKHSLCDTFDETQLSSIWTVPASCAQPFIDSTKFVSAPSSLLTNDLDSGAVCSSVYASVASADSTKFKSAFDLFLDAPNSAFEPFFSVLVTSTDFDFYEISLSADSTGAVHLLENLTFADGGPAYDVLPINAEKLTLGAWNNVAIAINFAGANSVSIAFRGGAPLSLALQHRPPVGSVSAYRVYLGVPNGGLGAKVEAHFDNFVCDVTP